MHHNVFSKMLEDKPMVSVLMTCYNREQYIATAIESVLASSYKTFELIIVDDASTDRTVDIAQSYLYDQRVKVFVNEKNLQQFQNRNLAAKYAIGKYLKYVDSDDIIYVHSLEIMVDIMEANPDCGMGFSYTSGNSPFPLPHRYSPIEIYNRHFFGGGILLVGPIGTIIKKKAFDAVQGFDLFGMPSDNHFSLKLAAKYPIVSMYRDLIWWRIHETQEFNGATENINIFQNYLWNQNVLSDPLCPLNGAARLKAIKNSKKIFLSNILKTFIINPFKLSDFVKLNKKFGINIFKIVKEVFI